MQSGEIILYQPDNSVQLEVRMEGETVWLTQAQIVELYKSSKANISEHIKNIYEQEELDVESTVRNFRTVRIEGNRRISRNITYYNLDTIISVGYRVNTKRGIQFRQWANKVLKDYMLRGYAINQRVERLEKKVADHDEKIDFFIKTSLPPREGLFFDGQIYDAFDFVRRIVKSAKKSITLIDNYIDDSVLAMMSDKLKYVKVDIYTKTVSKTLSIAETKFNEQYGGLTIKRFSFSHDRFLIIDRSEIYLVGASLKDLGKKWFAFSKLDVANIDEIMARLPKQ